MSGKGNPKGTNNGGGKPRKENATRHNVYIDNEVWEYLNRNSEPSKTIERLVMDEMDTVKILHLHAKLVTAIVLGGLLTEDDVMEAKELTALSKDAPDYIGIIAGANIENLWDGYVLGEAKNLLSENIEGV